MKDISVLIPFYNVDKYLARCIVSVIGHDVREIILVDDGSNDQSGNVAERYAAIDDRIRLLRHSNNLGRSAARNTALTHASGYWLAFLDADDYYLPNRFDDFDELASAGADGFYYGMMTAYEHKEAMAFFQEKFTAVKRGVVPEELLGHLILHDGERFSLNSFTVKRDVALEVGLFDTALTRGEDTDWIWRVAESARLMCGKITQPVSVRWVYKPVNFREQNLASYMFYKKWVDRFRVRRDRPELQRLLRLKMIFYKVAFRFPVLKPLHPLLRRFYRYV